jgi:hypothetical protein
MRQKEKGHHLLSQVMALWSCPRILGLAHLRAPVRIPMPNIGQSELTGT